MVELSGDRDYFVGRRGGIINVGVRNVHPEEVEAVINEILQLCREALSRHKVPTAIDFVTTLAVGAAGKMVRHDA